MHNTHADGTAVTVLGLGLMGQALAGGFLAAGHATTVWNRTPSKADDLVSRGAKLADSAADAVAASPLVVFCVTDYRAARELLEPLGATLEGRVLVNLTSGTSQDARQTAEWAARHGGVYLDGAIIAIPEAIGTPEAVVFYSGPRSEFDQHEPTLRALDADLPRFVKSLADRSVAAGQGGSSYAAMVELFRKPSAASG